MLNKLKILFYVLLVSVLFATCSGEDGDPGPQGEQGEPGLDGTNAIQKLGYFEGTVSGNRKDGTAFSETFKYQYSFDSLQAFYEDDGLKKITLSRSFNSTGDAYLSMYLMDESEGVLVPRSASYTTEFSFFKELSGDELFRIDAMPYYEITDAFVRELSAEQNEIYDFYASSNNQIYYYYSYHSPTGTYAYRFYYYGSSETYYIYYSESTGELLSVYDANESEFLESGPIFDLYNQIEFKYNATLDMMVFYDAATDEGLYEEVPEVPADQLNITNYVRNSTTGVITFDYELKISGSLSHYYRENSTNHDLTIIGKFNSGGKVFTNTTGRVKG